MQKLKSLSLNAIKHIKRQNKKDEPLQVTNKNSPIKHQKSKKEEMTNLTPTTTKKQKQH